MTVGSGIAPDLLTPSPLQEKGARGLGSPHDIAAPLPPVGTFTPP